MPSRLRHRLDALDVTAIGRAGDAASVDISLDVLVTLAQAIRDHVTVRFDYASREATDSDRSEARPARRAEPRHLVTSHGRWYLVSWDLDREDWRLFSVDRIRPRTPHGAPFIPRTVPGGDVGEFVSARFKGSDVNQWPCRGTVILHLPARDVLPFAGDGTVTALSEGTCTLEAGSWSWGALAASFGRFEVAMEVVEPPELAAAFTALADRFAATSRSANAAP